MASSASRPFPYVVERPPESPDDYKPGGFHPVQINDPLGGRYKVIGKLGWGGYSTVWAAEDTTRLRRPLVAVKVLMANKSQTSREVDFHMLLRNAQAACAADHPGRDHILLILDSFYISGSNGVHRCLVFPVMGISAADAALLFPGHDLPGFVVRHVSKQILQGLDFLHSHGIVHGDLHLGNICFCISEDDVDRKALSNPRFFEQGASHASNSCTKPTSDASNICTKPNYNQSLINGDWRSIRIKIIDFGEAFLEDEQSSHAPNTPASYRAPELIHEWKPNHKVDIWSFGCLMFEFVTGRTLFSSGSKLDSRERRKKIHSESIWSILKPAHNYAFLPRQWATREFQLLLIVERRRRQVFCQETLQENPEIFASRGLGMDPLNVEQLTDLLRNWALPFNSENRKEAKEILRHRWFTGA